MVPGPGDADSTGSATLTLKPKKGKVCFEITHTGLSPDDPRGASILEGAAGAAGGVEIILISSSSPSGHPSPISGCTKHTPAAVKKLAKNPGGFYLELTNSSFPVPNGAIRGQFHK